MPSIDVAAGAGPANRAACGSAASTWGYLGRLGRCRHVFRRQVPPLRPDLARASDSAWWAACPSASHAWWHTDSQLQVGVWQKRQADMCSSGRTGRICLSSSSMGAGPGRRADGAGGTPVCAAFLAGRCRGRGLPLHVGLPHPLLCRRARLVLGLELHCGRAAPCAGNSTLGGALPGKTLAEGLTAAGAGLVPSLCWQRGHQHVCRDCAVFSCTCLLCVSGPCRWPGHRWQQGC